MRTSFLTVVAPSETICVSADVFLPTVKAKLKWASLLLLSAFLAGSASAQQQSQARESSTKLQMNDNDYSSSGRKVITFTATVQSGGIPVQSGQVIFCDADARFCMDSAVLGKAQLDRTGSAVLRLSPTVAGQHHNLKAVFKGTWTYAGSNSDVIKNTVPDPPYPPNAVTLTSSGTPSAYTLTTTVAGGAYADTSIPSGTVDFMDTTTSKDLGTVTLNAGHEVVTYNNVGGGTTDSQPVSMALADFNNDGLPDVATANAGAANVNVLLSDGFGSFNAAPSLTLSGHPNAIATADFNGDGNADLVVSNISPNSGISVYLGIGDGTFESPRNTPTCAPATALVTGDFNHDGKPDIAVACISVTGQQLDILLGNGDGDFSPATPEPVVHGPVSFAVADFNGDGIEDLAVGEATSESVDILLGKGDGTFHRVQSLGTFNVPVAIVAGDFNNDGKVDLTVINRNANTAVTLLNNGAGIFHQSSLWHTGPGPTSVLASDLNLDGNLDLAIPISGWNSVMLLYGTGHGTFHVGGSLAVGKQPSAIVYGVAMGPSTYDPFLSLVIANKGSSTLTQIEADYFGESSATLNNVSQLGTGTFSVVGNYSGGGDWDPATSNSVTLKSYLQSATTLTLSASTVTAGTHVTLTGKVTANGAPVTSGVVRFCNASVASCVGSAWYGTASLNSHGIATITRTFAAGTYHINGRFPATSTDTKSTSATSTLTVKP